MPQAARGVAQIVGKGPEDGNLALLPTFFARLLNATERDKWPGGTLRRESYPLRRSIRSDEQCGRAALRRAHRYLCYPRSEYACGGVNREATSSVAPISAPEPVRSRWRGVPNLQF